jgi:hypothetical protein
MARIKVGRPQATSEELLLKNYRGGEILLFPCVAPLALGRLPVVPRPGDKNWSFGGAAGAARDGDKKKTIQPRRFEVH